MNFLGLVTNYEGTNLSNLNLDIYDQHLSWTVFGKQIRCCGMLQALWKFIKLFVYFYQKVFIHLDSPRMAMEVGNP